MIHQPFAFIDWIVLSAYLIIVILIGILYRSGREGIYGYFFARGQMPWWAVGISLIATSVSASTFLGNPAEAYQFDLRLLQLNLCVPVSIIIICAVFIPYFRRSGASSAYEILEHRFDLKTRTLASTLYMLHVLLRTGILIYGSAIMMSRISGIDIRVVIVAVGVITVAYTAMGGIRAVIWTDVLQFFILVAGAVLICIFVSIDIDGGPATVFQMAREAGKLRWFDTSWNLSDPRNIWAAGLAYVILDLAIRATDQQFVQRYLSCVDLRRTQYAAILSAILGLFMALLFFGVGIFLWAYYHSFPSELNMIEDVNLVLPHYIASKLPWGVSGLIVAAVFAAAMSSIDSAMSALSNTATVDFFKRFGGSERHALAFARLSTFLWGVLGVCCGLYAATFGMNIFELALSFTSLFVGALLGIFILALAVDRASGWGAFIGSIAGMVALALVTKVLQLKVAWPWYPVISMTVTLLVGWLTSFAIPRKIVFNEMRR
jgi:SSS family solute:Na+ symporter